MADTIVKTTPGEGLEQHQDKSQLPLKVPETHVQDVSSVASLDATAITPPAACQPQVNPLQGQPKQQQAPKPVPHQQHQQQQYPQVLATAPVNPAVAGYVTPQIVQIPQQPGQPPQTMMVINGQLVPISAMPVTISAQGPQLVPVALPPVQVPVQVLPTTVNVHANIVPKQPAVPTVKKDHAHQKSDGAEHSPTHATSTAADESAGAQTSMNSPANTTTDKKAKHGSRFWSALKKPFEQAAHALQSDEKESNESTKPDDASAPAESFGDTAVHMTINAFKPSTSQNDSTQTSRGANTNSGVADVQSTTAASTAPYTQAQQQSYAFPSSYNGSEQAQQPDNSTNPAVVVVQMNGGGGDSGYGGVNTYDPSEAYPSTAMANDINNVNTLDGQTYGQGQAYDQGGYNDYTNMTLDSGQTQMQSIALQQPSDGANTSQLESHSGLGNDQVMTGGPDYDSNDGGVEDDDDDDVDGDDDVDYDF